MTPVDFREVGVDWIGQVPKSWGCSKIKRHCFVKRGASPRPIDDPTYFDENGEYSWVRISDVTASDRYLTATEQRLSELGSTFSVKREPGDIFVSICASVGKPIITKIKCCIHDGFVWFDRLKLDSDFLFYLFTSGEMFKGLGNWGTQLNLNTDIIGEIEIPVPSLTEQQRIAAYLDSATGKIDRLMSLRRRQMELLREQRAALIQQAVTRGLNPRAPLKDSGLPWLGQIPKHWVMTRLKHLCSHIVDCLHMTPNYDPNGEYPAIRTADITPGKIDVEGAKRLTRGDYLIQVQRLTPLAGDIVYSREGERFGIAACVPPDTELCVSQRMMHFRVRKGVHSEFVMWQLNTQPVYAQALVYVFGSTSPHINVETIKNYVMFEPPFDEQCEIVDTIQRETAKLDGLHRSYQRQLELLAEYRASLIHESVTGQRPVPN